MFWDAVRISRASCSHDSMCADRVCASTSTAELTSLSRSLRLRIGNSMMLELVIQGLRTNRDAGQALAMCMRVENPEAPHAPKVPAANY